MTPSYRYDVIAGHGNAYVRIKLEVPLYYRLVTVMQDDLLGSFIIQVI